MITKMTNHFFISLFTALTFSVFAQDSPTYKISGQVIDEHTHLSLNNVSVQINGTLQGAITDSNGFFKLSYKEKVIILTFSLTGYEKKFIKLNESSNIPLTVTLSPKTEILKEIIINSWSIETVMKSNYSNVLDYSFYDDNILLLMFTNNLSKSKLVLISPNLDTLGKTNIPGMPSKLFKDCLGNNHVICNKNICQVFFDSTRLHLLFPSDIKTFEEILFPCIAEDSTCLYFMEKSGTHQIDMERFRIQTNNNILSYYYINKLNKQKNSLITITDQKTMELSVQEEKYLNGKETAGMYRKPVLKEFDRIFAETILYKEAYAPLFSINDTIYIFDYINSKIQCYSSGKLSKELEIKFHADKNWNKEMCVDEKTHRAYAIYESNGITELKEINLNNGLLNNSYKIPLHFVENIKVHDNYIYFLYQGKEYSDNKFLSRLRID